MRNVLAILLLAAGFLAALVFVFPADSRPRVAGSPTPAAAVQSTPERDVGMVVSGTENLSKGAWAGLGSPEPPTPARRESERAFLERAFEKHGIPKERADAALAKESEMVEYDRAAKEGKMNSAFIATLAGAASESEKCAALDGLILYFKAHQGDEAVFHVIEDSVLTNQSEAVRSRARKLSELPSDAAFEGFLSALVGDPSSENRRVFLSSAVRYLTSEKSVARWIAGDSTGGMSPEEARTVVERRRNRIVESLTLVKMRNPELAAEIDGMLTGAQKKRARK